MKLARSILSPGRAARDGAVAAGGPVSLSSSLSRRLRSNGSLKGGASPFLSATGKRRAGGFENPEPSSPKVTCIGQVRVKSKKKMKQARSQSKRRAGEISFRKTEQKIPADNNGGGVAQVRHSNAGGAHYRNPQAQECLPHRNQRWVVHVPMSICDTLREFSCLFPCKGSCFSRERVEEKQAGPDEGECGSVFAPWLVSVNDGEGGSLREIELVVGEGNEEDAAVAEVARVSMRNSRRHVFEDIEVRGDRIEIKGKNLGGEVESARISICVPPKNALLLMRCRSDPMKMASLAGRFSWDSQGACNNDSENNDHEQIDEVLENQDIARGCEGKGEVFEQKPEVLITNSEEHDKITDESDEGNPELFMEAENFDENKEDELLEETVGEKGRRDVELEKEFRCNEEKLDEGEEDEVESNMSSFEALLDDECIAERYGDGSIVQAEEEETDDSPSIYHLSPTTETNTEINRTKPVLEQEEALMENENGGKEENGEESSAIAEKDPIFVCEDSEESRVLTARVKEPDPDATQQEQGEENSKMEEPAFRRSFEEPKRDKGNPTLPECLLLMMREPKLSMEVSKETWVCTTDFVRWLPERPRRAAAAAKAAKPASGEETRLSVDLKPASNKPTTGNGGELHQPPRSSCSLPVAAATAVEQKKLANAAGYDSFVLTRCKSEPMGTAAAKLMPESCFWKNAVRKMEPHRRAVLGVGSDGAGF